MSHTAELEIVVRQRLLSGYVAMIVQFSTIGDGVRCHGKDVEREHSGPASKRLTRLDDWRHPCAYTEEAKRQ